MSGTGSGELGSGLDQLTEISQTAAFVASITQAGVFVSMGPFICIYGPSIFRLVAFLRALFASNYVHFISAVAAVDEMTAFEVFCDKMIVLLTGTLTLTIASLRNRRIRAYAAGAVMGTMILTPLVQLVRQQLYFGPVGCTGIGEKSALFPDGAPIGCDHTSTEFQLTFQGTKFVLVAGVAAFAFAGQVLMDFSIALMGATMICQGSLDLMKVILVEIIPQEQADEVVTTFATLEPWLVYAIAAGGYVLQKALLHYVPKPEDDGLGDNDEIKKLKQDLQTAQEKAAKEMGAKITFEKVAVLRERSEVKVPLIGCMVTGCLGKTMKLLHKADEALGKYIENMDNKDKGKSKNLGKAKKSPMRMIKDAVSPKKKKKEPKADEPMQSV